MRRVATRLKAQPRQRRKVMEKEKGNAKLRRAKLRQNPRLSPNPKRKPRRPQHLLLPLPLRHLLPLICRLTLLLVPAITMLEEIASMGGELRISP